jgi:hypothetical protein
LRRAEARRALRDARAHCLRLIYELLGARVA